jgi:hypothetical protein
MLCRMVLGVGSGQLYVNPINDVATLAGAVSSKPPLFASTSKTFYPAKDGQGVLRHTAHRFDVLFLPELRFSFRG